LSALVCITLVWYSIRVFADSRQIGALVMKSLVFPEWWLFVPLPICFALMAIECARRVRSPAPPPA
jgi:TRAP-type C4-dicarboxylate transport system permease small subunit